MITCCSCRQALPETAFAYKSKVSGRRQTMCRECKSAYNRSWYRDNKSSHRSSVANNNQAYRDTVKEDIRKLKSVPCADCGDEYPWYVMDFDHLPGTIKEENISRMISNRVSWSRIRAEIDKCDVVCANCHRIRTYLRLCG